MRCAPLLLALLLPLFAGCDRPSPAEDTAPELALYAVPAAHTEQIASALNDAFAAGSDARVARASARIPGQLLVLAPAATQASIRRTLDELAPGAPRSTPDAPGLVRIRYWLVDAVAGGTQHVPSAAPAQIAAALDEATRHLGAVSFHVVDEVVLVSGSSGLSSELSSTRGTQVDQTLSPQEGGVLASVRISHSRHVDGSDGATTERSTRLRAELPLRPGETVVLGQVLEQVDGQQLHRFVLMRAEAVDPA